MYSYTVYYTVCVCVRVCGCGMHMHTIIYHSKNIQEIKIKLSSLFSLLSLDICSPPSPIRSGAQFAGCAPSLRGGGEHDARPGSLRCLLPPHARASAQQDKARVGVRFGGRGGSEVIETEERERERERARGDENDVNVTYYLLFLFVEYNKFRKN